MGSNSQSQQPFTILNERQIKGLLECGASCHEWAAYATLARYHDAAGTCNANAAGNALALGIDQKAFARAVRSLARKSFTARDGAARPVLIRTPSPARKGHNAEWIDALFLDSMEPDGDADKGERIGTPYESPKGYESVPLTHDKGVRIGTPYEDAKGNESVPLTNPKGYELVPKGVRTRTQRGTNSYPHKNKEERKIFSAEDAATQAPRADLAAEGPTPDRGTGEGSHDAPTMEPPTLAEWMELERRLGSGPDALTPAEEARRLEGFAIYARPPKPRGAA